MIKNIEVSKIKPHKDNPRKDLGDLTELAASIKAKGVLQNLTVVPWFSYLTMAGADDPAVQAEMGYIVVIGHRRLAAAKLAGLETVPCVISNMSYVEQLETMLLENMQRSDLTYFEQAQGMQLLLNLGDTVEQISEKTGFSQTTVRRRVKLLELDQDKFKESLCRGASLLDYAKLEQLKSEAAKNKVLEYIGTNNFEWQLKSAIEEQERPERKKALLEILDTFATKLKDKNEIGSTTFEKSFYGFSMNEWKKPNDAETVEYYYIVENNSISLYKKQENTQSTREISPEEKEYNRREAEIKRLTKQAYATRYEFVKNFSAGKKYASEINKFAFSCLLVYSNPTKGLYEMFDIEIPDTKEMSYDEIRTMKRNLLMEKFKEAPECAMFKAAYIALGDYTTQGDYSASSWDKKISYYRSSNLDRIYDGLISVGYELSTEEQQLRDGTHELYDQKSLNNDSEDEDFEDEDFEDYYYNDEDFEEEE